MKTIRTPIKIPITTHNRRPKIDVCFESCVFMKAPSKIDIVAERREEKYTLSDFLAIEELAVRF